MFQNYIHRNILKYNIVTSISSSAVARQTVLATRRNLSSSAGTSHHPHPPKVIHSEVLYREEGQVGIITLNAPSRLNSLTLSLAKELDWTVQQVDYTQIGALVITGEGRAFSAGGDYQFLLDRSKDTPYRNSEIMRKFYELFLRIRKLPVPLIAAINGPAVGAGLCFAAAMDLRLALNDAKLGVTFVGIGLHPGMASTYFLPKLVGPQIASRMLLTGELISGDEAARIGLTLESVQATGSTPIENNQIIVKRAVELGQRIASQSPLAVRTCVRSLRLNTDEGLEKALWREADSQAHCYSSKDFREGVEAIMNKRKPVWKEYNSLPYDLTTTTGSVDSSGSK